MASHSPLAPVRPGNGEYPISGQTRLVTEVTALREHLLVGEQPAVVAKHVGQKARPKRRERHQLSGAGKALLSELPAPTPQPPVCTGCLGSGRGQSCRSPAFTALRTACNLIAFPDGVRSESKSGKYDRKDSHVWPISISWLVNCVQFVFYGHLLLIWSERRRGDYFWFGVF